MKSGKNYLLICLCCLTVVFLACGEDECGGDEIVYNAYYEASLYPEDFDFYARENLSGECGEKFLSCIEEMKFTLAESFARVTEHCSGLPPEYRDECYDVDEAAIMIFLDSMAAVVRGEASFGETFSGLGALAGKYMFGTEFWISMQEMILTVYKPVLVCD